ncbi:MAG TPA: GTPase ObgE [Candidatus Saccharimonadales bacterium]
MSFVDKVEVKISAGNGGNGKRSFRHERYVDKGGPDGGDGGNGGNVVLEASRNQNTLATFRYNKELVADGGQPGGTSRKHGRSASDLIVKVPVGTQAADSTGKIYADLIVDGQREIIANGGKGGFGNAHFVSSIRQAPNFAEKGEPGEVVELTLELKIIADIGLVGLPNAGKSTLLSRLSNARPEIADYPFTTLKPNLGVVDIDKSNSLLIADIPGLIEGASKGKGLGHEFLRHIERTRLIVHLVDIYQEDVAATYKIIRKELKAYSPLLAKLPELVVLNKIDGVDEQLLKEKTKQLKACVTKKTDFLPISAQAGTNLDKLKYLLKAKLDAITPEVKVAQEDPIPVLKITDKSDAWEVVKTKSGGFIVTGLKIEQFASRTDLDNQEAINRLKVIMKRMGILHELNRQGLEFGDTIYVGKAKENSFYY